jgi:hypothetical protein
MDLETKFKSKRRSIKTMSGNYCLNMKWAVIVAGMGEKRGWTGKKQLRKMARRLRQIYQDVG